MSTMLSFAFLYEVVITKDRNTRFVTANLLLIEKDRATKMAMMRSAKLAEYYSLMRSLYSNYCDLSLENMKVFNVTNLHAPLQ